MTTIRSTDVLNALQRTQLPEPVRQNAEENAGKLAEIADRIGHSDPGLARDIQLQRLVNVTVGRAPDEEAIGPAVALVKQILAERPGEHRVRINVGSALSAFESVSSHRAHAFGVTRAIANDRGAYLEEVDKDGRLRSTLELTEKGTLTFTNFEKGFRNSARIGGDAARELIQKLLADMKGYNQEGGLVGATYDFEQQVCALRPKLKEVGPKSDYVKVPIEEPLHPSDVKEARVRTRPHAFGRTRITIAPGGSAVSVEEENRAGQRSSLLTLTQGGSITLEQPGDPAVTKSTRIPIDQARQIILDSVAAFGRGGWDITFFAGTFRDALAGATKRHDIFS